MKEPRILNLQELEASEEWEISSYKLWENCFTKASISHEIIGETVKWCKKKGITILPEMIAPQEQEQEEPQEGDLVQVWDDDIKPTNPSKRIFLSKLKGGKVICVYYGYENEYLKGDEFLVSTWKNYAPIPKPTAEEIAEKVCLSVEELKKIVLTIKN